MKPNCVKLLIQAPLNCRVSLIKQYFLWMKLKIKCVIEVFLLKKRIGDLNWWWFCVTFSFSSFKLIACVLYEVQIKRRLKIFTFSYCFLLEREIIAGKSRTIGSWKSLGGDFKRKSWVYSFVVEYFVIDFVLFIAIEAKTLIWEISRDLENLSVF